MAKSEYLQREEAAKKQLGTKGVKKRVKQLPTAARAFTREMTGVDISRKGVSVDPLGVAMAFPVFKAGKAAAALKGALGAIPATKKAATLAKIAYNEGRVLSRIAGREATSGGGSLINDVAMKNMARQGLRDFENIARPITERLPYALKKANRAGRSNVSDATVNIVDTRRMNPAQAKSALEGGVSQVAKFARRTPAKEKPVKGVTGRLLRGRER